MSLIASSLVIAVSYEKPAYLAGFLFFDFSLVFDFGLCGFGGVLKNTPTTF